ncbi:MAG: NusG domain II-containing protein [Clostridiales bacterium]|jgi:hypothetical protein|nr:NusG domain II-containing protein [Clostridiales bacterium]
MDRRDFLRTLLATAAVTPTLLEARSLRSSSALYLISDTPEDVLASVLAEIGSYTQQAGRFFAFLTPHPKAKEINKALSALGWKLDKTASRPGMVLSFQPLGLPSLPSFTLIRNGRVHDIRTQRLWQAWKRMTASGAFSSCLTIASLEQPRRSRVPGKAVSVYADGKRLASLPLARDVVNSFHTRAGRVVVGIEAGRARVISSSCQHQVCLASPPIFLARERIVCAPRHFLLEVEGPRLVDTVTG